MKNNVISQKNKALKILFIVPMVSFVVACNNNSNSNTTGTSNGSSDTSETSKIPSQGEKIRVLDGVTFDESKAFFDDFADGVSYEDWIIGSGAWGNGNGGVIPDNVSYTEDGVLLLRGNGLHYAGDEIKGVGTIKDGRNTGAAIISKFTTGPGRYEVKMKPLPRQGACTALWTYNNQVVPGEPNANHEIDIELPGGKTDGVISFKNLLNTNYITEQFAHSQDINMESVSSKPVYLNDGEFHTFGFDWYTNPELIVYHCDGIVTAVSDVFIPDMLTRVWLGEWFPNNAGFVGDSLFETDYMYVDWFKYLPFDDTQTYVESDPGVSVAPALENQYPTAPTAYPEVNLISNGDFEYIKNKDEINGYGWNYSKLNSESQDASAVCFPSLDGGDDSCGVTIKDGGYLFTNIDSVYEGYEYTLHFDAKTNGEDSRVVLNFVNPYSSKAIESKVVEVKGDEWNHYSIDVKAPKDSYAIRIEAYNAKSASTMNIDNFELVRK